jgi:PAS domain S-box-containing protein
MSAGSTGEAAKQALMERIVRSVQAAGWATALLLVLDETGQTYRLAACATTDPVNEATLTAWLHAAFRPGDWSREQALIGHVYSIASESPRDHLAEPDRALMAALCGEMNPASRDESRPCRVLLIPLADEGSGVPLGWLVAGGPSEALSPVETEARILEALARQVALTLEQARLHRQSAGQVARQKILNEVAHTLSQHLEFRELFPAVLARLQDVFSFTRASITLLEGQRAYPRIFAQDQNGNLVYDTRVTTPLEDIAFALIKRRVHTARLIGDLAGQAQLDPSESQLQAAGIRSYCCLPLLMWGQVIGVFSLADHHAHALRGEDTELLVQLAGYIAGAVWNAVLHELEQARRQTADALAQLSKIVNSTLELDRVLALALEQLARVIVFDSASILLVDGPNLKIAACRGFSDPSSVLHATFQLDERNVAHTILRTQQVHIEPDVQQLEAWGHHRDDIEGAHTIRAWLGVPLIVRNDSIGVLTIDKHEPDFYTEEDGETAAAFAAQISTAINNARLYQGLQQQRDRLTAILNDATDAILVLDQAGRIFLLNPAAERVLKVHREAVTEQPVTALDLPELSAAFGAAQDADGPVTREIPGLDGSFFHASIAPVHEVGWVIVMQDITALKELDLLRTEWVATVSHDLKNPIQMILLGASVLETDEPLTPEQAEHIRLIQRSAQQLSELVTDVLDLARMEAGPSLQRVRVRLRDVLLAASTKILDLAAKKQQQLLTEMPDDLPSVLGDAAALRRALTNLLSNAVKYTPEGGRIELRAQVSPQQVRIDVIDDGPGIPAEALPHLFKPFYRVPDSQAEGTGLGLHIVRSIVEKHNGSVAVESEPGQGSTFSIVLPRLLDR